MNRHTIWIILAVTVMFGFGLEFFKSQAAERVKIARLGQGNGLLEDGLAVYRPGAHEEFKAPIDPPTSAPPAETKADEVKPSPTPTSATKLEKKPEPDKKNDKKKKKKKKKPVPRLIPLIPQQPIANPEGGKETPKSAGGGGGMNAGPMNAALGVNAAATGNTPKTAKEWEDLLLVQADVEMTEKFIKAYQAGAISSDVYYEVITAMLDASNPEIKKLGVTALGATPSVKSFETLISIDRNGSFPSSAKTQVKVYIRVYTRLENLKILISVVSKSQKDNATPSYEAVLLMQKSAETYLRTASTASTTPQSTQVRGLSYQVAGRYFTPVLNALKASQTWPDKSVSQAATTAYNAVAALMPTAPTNTQVAAGPTTP